MIKEDTMEDVSVKVARLEVHVEDLIRSTGDMKKDIGDMKGLLLKGLYAFGFIGFVEFITDTQKYASLLSALTGGK
jgi:hypothetical protein